MNIKSHVDQLQTKHKDIERVIAKELQRPSPDTVRITKLKRKKLMLKEELSRLSP